MPGCSLHMTRLTQSASLPRPSILPSTAISDGCRPLGWVIGQSKEVATGDGVAGETASSGNCRQGQQCADQQHQTIDPSHIPPASIKIVYRKYNAGRRLVPIKRSDLRDLDQAGTGVPGPPKLRRRKPRAIRSPPSRIANRPMAQTIETAPPPGKTMTRRPQITPPAPAMHQAATHFRSHSAAATH